MLLSESKFNLNKPVPLLFLGDGPDQHTGLARIGRDLAFLASSMPEFRVGYLGRDAFGANKFPWAQYSFHHTEQWGEWKLQRAFHDFVGEQADKAIIMTVWDASRLLWFARPEYGLPQSLSNFLQSGRFERWGYFMVDGEGVEQGRLPGEQAEVLAGYDRALLASEWGYELAKGSPALSDRADRSRLDWLPHPINGDRFYWDANSSDTKALVRVSMGVSPGEHLIGCVMTNQARKHWPTVLEAIAILKQKSMVPVKLWLHTDIELRYWNIPALLVEYGLEDDVVGSSNVPLSDSVMAARYRACDVTVLCSGGEGFGYPVAESLAVGTPVIASGYGAHCELMQRAGQDLILVNPVITTVDTIHNVRRGVFNPGDFAQALAAELYSKHSTDRSEKLAKAVEHLHMMRLGKMWKRWLLDGINGGRR